MESGYYYSGILPVAAMIVTEICGVGSNTLFKAASSKGMSYFVFYLYTSIINVLLLLPIPFFLCSRRMIPLFKFPLLSRICALGIIGCCQAFCSAYWIKRIKIYWPNHGICNGQPHSSLDLLICCHFQESSQSDWVIGGFLLAIQHILHAFLFILQTQMVQICPSSLLLQFWSYLYTTIISAPVCFIAEPDLKVWRLRPDITLVALVFSGILGGASIGTIHLWCMQLKGPVFVTTFRPLSMVIAAAMATIFLGDALHLGSVIGGVLVASGVYAVLRGKAKEAKVGEDLSSISTTPLLQ